MILSLAFCLTAYVSLAYCDVNVTDSPAWGPGATARPEKYGYKTQDVVEAYTFIAQHVKVRECFLMAKNGEIIADVYLAGFSRLSIFKGYSMTKTIGFLLILMAASKGELDIDADITKKYGIPSPKTYGVSSRMMMSMVLGGETGPGELWRYDEIGNLWLGMLPKVLHKATGKTATQWFQELHASLGLSPSFTWSSVETNWARGAQGTCEDWGRFAQLVLNDGYWGDISIIAPSFMRQAQEPVKYDPYQMYSNPCYGLGWWLNPDKQKYNGCCWEASRLPPPNCNNETFIQGATHNLTFTLGLYGQVLMAVPERNVTIVSLGKDLRPIEPIRIGVYPAVCKMLGLPCNTPPKVPSAKCGETLECLGMSAQCFTGYGKWGHEEPVPGGAQCIQCFQQRVRDQSQNDTEAQQMIRDNCPISNPRLLSNYLECFCYDGDNVFSPWPTTTTTTPPLKPRPPVPHPYTTPAPSRPLPCDVTPQCWEALNNVRDKGGRGPKCVDYLEPGYCGLCLHKNWGPRKYLAVHGCPTSAFDYETVGLCLCGPLDPTPKQCITKISGVCNEYTSPVTLRNSHLTELASRSPVSGRRRRDFGCTAPPGGSCQVGLGGLNAGEYITDCAGYAPIDCYHTSGPSVRSADNMTNFRFWSNHTGRQIVRQSSDIHGQPAGNKTMLAHTCGWHEQWSIVIDKQGDVSFFPSIEGLMCPNSAALIV